MPDWELFGWALVVIAVLASIMAMKDAIDAHRRQRDLQHENEEMDLRYGADWRVR